MAEVISSFGSLRVGSQVFALLMLFLSVISHTMWSGKSLKYVSGYCGLSENGRCVFGKLQFIVVF